jgi:S1-C subfamily serine protease
MAEVLQNVSNDLAATVETAGVGVVRVEARRRMPASGVVWSSDGIIVTSHHVVERDDNITIGLANGETVSAQLVGRDPTTDIAVLRVPSGGLSAPNWAETETLKVGHLVLALGRPGRTVQATLGVVSALGEGWRTSEGGTIDRYLQTDVVMYPGFSGGPLVDASARILGLNSSALARGVSVTLPTGTIRRVVEALVTHGRVKRGFLGIKAQPVQLPQAIAQQVGQETGVMLASVEQGSPADKSGLVLGDTLVTFDSEPVRHMDDLLGLLTTDRVGRGVSTQILRGGQLQTINVTVGEHE